MRLATQVNHAPPTKEAQVVGYWRPLQQLNVPLLEPTLGFGNSLAEHYRDPVAPEAHSPHYDEVRTPEASTAESSDNEEEVGALMPPQRTSSRETLNGAAPHRLHRPLPDAVPTPESSSDEDGGRYALPDPAADRHTGGAGIPSLLRRPASTMISKAEGSSDKMEGGGHWVLQPVGHRDAMVLEYLAHLGTGLCQR